MSRNDDIEIPSEPKEILLGEYTKCPLAIGDLLWKKKQGKVVCLLKAGDPFDDELFRRYAKLKDSLYVRLAIHDEFIKETVGLFKQLKEASWEGQRVHTRKLIVEQFAKRFWVGSSEGSMMDLVVIGMETFYNLDNEFIQTYLDKSLILFKRSMVMATIGVFWALSMGYTEFTLLQDLYHVLLLQDYSLVDDEFSFLVFEALKHEHHKGQEGHEYLLSQQAAEWETRQFLSHPNVQDVKIKKHLEACLHRRNMVHVLKIHHERVDGTGFPFGLKENVMNDLELLTLTLSSIFSFEDIEMNSDGGKGLFRKLLQKDGVPEGIKRHLNRVFEIYEDKEMYAIAS